ALRAEISFVIHKDGSVSGIDWVRRSGDLSFDLEARGAVEAAGRARAFGSLPKGYPRDRLRVSFFFDPTSY
ncbi:MAG TPA: TonB C-terminal domain-containing protein, partial [Gemmatimonadota bacterium]|nr:TonB C-terminal domain-containing protein [Gemmatimonadota bacterium]